MQPLNEKLHYVLTALTVLAISGSQHLYFLNTPFCTRIKDE